MCIEMAAILTRGDEMEKKVKVKKVKAEKASPNTAGAGIRTKMMSMFVLLIVIPILAMGFMMYNQSKNILEETLMDSSTQLVDQAEVSITNYLKRFEDIGNFLATDANVQQVKSYPDSEEWMFKSFNNLLSVNDEILFVYIGTKEKDMFMKPDSELPEGYDPTGRPWYTQAMSVGDITWSPPYNDASTGDLIVTVAKPVENIFQGNELVGVLGLDVSLNTLAEKINAITIGEHGYAVLLDADKTILTHPNAELIGEPLPVQEISDAIDAGQEFVHYTYNGEEKFTAINAIEGLGWIILGTVDQAEIADNTKTIRDTIFMIGTIVLVVGLLVSFIFSKSITGNVKKVLDSMEQVKNGDLTARLKLNTRDELGRLGKFFNDTMDELSGLIRNIKTVSSEVGMSSQNLAASSEQASASAEEVSRTVEEIAKGASDQAMDSEKGVQIAMNLSSKFTHLNERTIEMINSAEDVVEANVHGTDAIAALKDKTKQTDDANDRIEKVIEELDNKTQSIGAILDSISAIAVQTNLLALNASIEAARAGEHGKGFAVVAEEIRKLAEESSTAADEIREITTTIMADSAKSVESMKEVRDIAKEQTEAVQNVDTSFDTISTSISTIVAEIQNIKGSVEELTSDKDQIVHAIENISAVSEQTAAASEEVSASMDQQSAAVGEVANAAETLNEISLELNKEIDKFKV